MLARLGFIAFTLLPIVQAGDFEPCVPTSADPASLITFTLPPNRTFYLEERDNPLGAPVPGSGFLIGADTNGDGIPEPLEGHGTYLYEESNGLPGLQRNCFGLLCDSWLPAGCSQNPDWEPTEGTVPCLLYHGDPVTDEHCGFGWDTLVTSLVGPGAT